MTKQPKVIIRPMRRQDADAVIRMVGRLNAFHGDHSKLKKSFLLQHALGPNKTARFWVAITAGNPIGVAQTSDRANFVRNKVDCMLNLLFVEEAYRGMNIGYMLTIYTASDAVKRGCARFMTTSAPKNLKAKEFYLGVGFKARRFKPISYLIEGTDLIKLTKKKI